MRGIEQCRERERAHSCQALSSVKDAASPSGRGICTSSPEGKSEKIIDRLSPYGLQVMIVAQSAMIAHGSGTDDHFRPAQVALLCATGQNARGRAESGLQTISLDESDDDWRCDYHEIRALTTAEPTEDHPSPR